MPLARHRLASLAATLCLTAGAHAGTLLTERFDDVGGLSAAGWLQVNLDPDPALTVDWYQGDSDVFASHDGDAGAYAASSWGAAAPGTTLANWLITPTFSTLQAGTVTFWLRGAADPGFTDTVRFGFSSGSADPGQFVLADAVTAVGAWTNYSVSFAAGAAGSTARFAIEHTGPDDLADYVGIDDLRVATTATTAVPEPANGLLLGVGLAALAAWRWRATRCTRMVAASQPSSLL